MTMPTFLFAQIIPQSGDYLRILPELLLSAFGIVVMLLDPLMDEERSQKTLGLIALLGTIAGLGATWYASQSPGLAFSNMVRIDNFSVFFHFLVIAIAAVVILSSFEYMAVQRIRAGEYYALILFSVVGMGLMSSAIELVLIFIALEISSISTYILAGFRRQEASSSEASLKYFLLGSFATAFFLYGVALMFGATGSTNVETISRTLQTGPAQLLVYVAVAFMLVGLGFKVAAAPLHIWTPDVYEGAPAPVTGFMSTAPKAAAFAVLLRVVFAINAPGRFWPIWVAAALSMTLGNVSALVQTNVKRLLAYSSIAHVGYMLLGLIAGSATELNADGIKGILVYLLVYTFMNLGAFGVITSLRHKKVIGDELDDLNGLYTRAPIEAVLMLIFMLSLAGIPPLAGFWGKYFIFLSLISTGHYALAALGVLYSVFGLYYYLKIANAMFMRQPEKGEERLPISYGMRVGLGVTAFATVFIGVMPNRFIEMANWALGIAQNPNTAKLIH